MTLKSSRLKLKLRPVQNKSPEQVLLNLLDYIESYLGTIKMKLKEEINEHKRR